MRDATVRRIAFGRNRLALLAGLVAGVVLGLDVWWVYPHVGEIYNLVPDSPIDWQYLAVFVAVPALVAARNGGLVTCWWVDFPPLLAIYLLEFTVVGSAGGESAIREFSVATVPSAVLVASVVALLWGTAGYLVGRGAKVGIRRAGPHPVESTGR